MDTGEQVREIDGVTYRVRPLMAGASLKVMARTLRMIAPAFGSVGAMKQAAGAGMAVLGNALSDLDEATLDFVCAEFAKVTHVEGEKNGKPTRVSLSTCFDLHFAGRLMALFEWLKFAAEVTYGPLFESLKAKTDAPGEAAPAAE